MSYLASLYRERKDLKSAIALLERVVERNPDNDRYRFTLGAAYDEAKDKTRTIEQMKRAVELNPKNADELAGDDPTVAEHLGDAYGRAGKPRDALRLYQDALARAKEAAQVERLKGKVHSLEAAARSEGTGL